MIYMLVIFYSTSVSTVPYQFAAIERCQASGEAWMASKRNWDAASSYRYVCLPVQIRK